jgi:hypothetical protein
MKRNCAITLLLLLISGAAYADVFQFSYKNDKGETGYVRHSKIEVFTADGKTRVFSGWTDGYGRIRIDLEEHGTYRARVEYRGETLSAKVRIDGRRKMKRVRLE